MKSVLWLIALAGCTESAADKFAKPPQGGPAVELAAVTLDDDCPPPPPASPPATATPPVAPKPGITRPPSDQAPAPSRRAPGAVSYQSCNQTTMQLAITAPADGKPATVKVKKVELLDTDGKLLQTLTPRNARAWKDPKDTYRPWDEKLAPRASLKAMYDLSAPDWNTLTKGRWNAHTRTFQVRVVVEIGGSDKTVTKSAITAARLPPPVPT